MNKFLYFFNLHEGEDDKENVLESVVKNISFRGANAWILACAIVVASVGLNVNSTAVIIGAMLISPLMGPIIGAGFALGTYNFPLLKKSMKNLGIATLISLVVSFIYFLLSPFKDAQSELLARTSPNIYDVLIAVFGGLVGVIAITRENKGNPIPGVAIATALMPPLCTAGYGLAIGNLAFFAGAIYLYFINCFFICLATFVIVKYLKYPKINFVDAKKEKRITRSITFLILVLVLPSFYFAYILLQERKYVNKVNQFIQQEFVDRGYTIIYERLQFNAKPKKIELAFLSKKMDDREIQTFQERLKKFGISNTELIIRQDSLDLKADILKEINKQSYVVSEKDITIRNLSNRISRFELDHPQLNKNIQVLFPQITSYTIGRQTGYVSADSSIQSIALIYDANTELEEAELFKLSGWLKNQYPKDSVIVLKR